METRIITQVVAVEVIGITALLLFLAEVLVVAGPEELQLLHLLV
jgi:hypothetical protein